MDRQFIKKAVENSDLNALRIALLQATGDSELEAMRVIRIPLRAGASVTFSVSPEDRSRLVDKAVDFLLTRASTFEKSVPSDGLLRELMQCYAANKVMSDEDFEVRKPFVALDPYPRAAHWNNEGPTELEPGFMIAIVGAGFSGLAMAVQLEKLGLPYVLFERRSEIGGTWSINTYPDARVDTPSSVYEFSFEKQYPWTEYFARQGEVRNYLEHIAHKYNVYSKIHFCHDVKSGTFDERTSTWQLDITNKEGKHDTFKANFVLSAAGLFSSPRELEVEGREDFKGEFVHSTEWNSENTAAGKSVAVIGNGSTGVQMLRSISKEAKQVYVFQRSPQWISPRERYGEVVPIEERWLLDNMPYYWNWSRYTTAYATLDAYQLMVPDPEWQASGGKFNRSNDSVRNSLIDYIATQCEGRKDLIQKLTPQSAPFARRLVVDNGWYRTLLEEHVELVTEPISRFTPNGIVTADGKVRQVDLVVASIGFAVEKYVWPADYLGRGGCSLQKSWNDGAYAYMGTLVPGLPNFFLLFGPNSMNAVGEGGTLPTQAEMWAAYVAKAIMLVLDRKARSIEVKATACDEYNKRIDEASRGLIWTTEGKKVHNYWLRNGRLQVSYPWPLAVMQKHLQNIQVEDLIIN